MNALLTDKNAVIYGAAGSIGGATARTFAREGATVFLAGRTRETLEEVARDIAAAGGVAHVDVVDATDEDAVVGHAQSVVDRGGSLDVSFTSISREDVQGTPLVDLSVEDYLRSITQTARANFLTGRAAVRHMAASGGGVILHLTSASSRGTQPGMGNTGPTDAAVESFYRYLAAENGPAGVRVAGIHTAAVRETLTREKIQRVNPKMAEFVEDIVAGLEPRTMLGHLPELQSIAETAAFLASDRASNITSGIVNATCGMVPG